MNPSIWLGAIGSLILGASPATAAELRFTIKAAPETTASIRAMVFADATSFTAREHPVAALILTPRNGEATASIAGLPAGRYAIATFQDLNGDGTLATNLLGIPTEPYGFSNDAAGQMGPPSFDQAAIQLDGDRAVTIHLR